MGTAFTPLGGADAPALLGRAVTSLWKDGAVRGVVLFLAAISLPVSLPLLGETARAFWGEHLMELPMLLVLVTGLLVRAHAVDNASERRFWRLLAAGFLFWVLSDVVNLARGFFASGDLQRLLVNGPFLLFYGAVVLALEVDPHVRSDPDLGRLRRLDRVGAAVFLFGLLMYFLVLPSLQNPLWDSSLALFTVLDVYLVLRLAGLRDVASNTEWRSIYAWLMAGAVIWGLGDIGLMLMNEGILRDPGYGTPFDAVMPLAMGAVLVATRARTHEPISLPRVHAAREPLGMGPVVGYAVLMPLIHLLLYRSSLADQAVKAEREILVFGIALALALIALAYHSRLVMENRRLAWDEAISRRTLTRLAFNDGLTGLPNRELFQDRLAQAMEDARRYERKCAVYFLDLDDFKVINDSLGHKAGDEVLVAAARRLRFSVRGVDTVARFGGDEFTVISQGIGSGLDAARAAEKMLAALSESVMVDGRRHCLTASMGVAVFPDDGEDQSTLLRHADMAMYQAKVQGGNTYRLFTQ
jgi:diguanylate cyclase (GGDEF)-like protein